MPSSAPLYLGKRNIRMHCGKKTCRYIQCDAMGSALLGAFRSWRLCGCYFDMYYPPKHCCSPRTSFRSTVLPNRSIVLQRNNTHSQTLNCSAIVLRKITKNLNCWHPNSPALNLIKLRWDVLDQAYSMKAPHSNLQDFNDLLPKFWCCIPQKTFRGIYHTILLL